MGVTKIECDDEASENPSSGDPDARRADVSIEPAERATCTFTVASGQGVIKLKTEPRGRDMTFDFIFPPPPRPCVTRDSGGCGLSVDPISLSDGESETVCRPPETLGECVMSGPMVFVTAIILALTTGFTTGSASDRWTDRVWPSMRMWTTGREHGMASGAFHQKRVMMLHSRVTVTAPTPMATVATPAHWRRLMDSPIRYATSAAITANWEASTAVTAMLSWVPMVKA